MRILHTSDWHFGRGFGAISLADDQASFVDWLVEVVTAEQVELVVIAGDVYDRAIPPTESVALFRDALRRVRDAGAMVVAIAGNHDSAERVAAYDGLTDVAGVYLRGGYARAADIIRIRGVDGPLDIVAVPYLDPLMAPAPAPLDELFPAAVEVDPHERRTHHSVLDEQIRLARGRITAPRSLAVAHVFATGGTSSDSERLLTVGGTGQVAAAAFDGFSYAALGHLHQPQLVAGRPDRRYSGSPLAYSHSESHAKQVLIVDMNAMGHCTVREIPIDVGRRVATITGRLDDLLHDPRHEAAVDRLVRAVITDPTPVVEAKATLRRRFPFVTEVHLQPDLPDGHGTASLAAADRHRLSPLAAAEAFWNEIAGTAPDDDERSLLDDVLSAAELERTAR